MNVFAKIATSLTTLLSVGWLMACSPTASALEEARTSLRSEHFKKTEATLSNLIKEYPDSDEAMLAKEWLERWSLCEPAISSAQGVITEVKSVLENGPDFKAAKDNLNEAKKKIEDARMVAEVKVSMLRRGGISVADLGKDPTGKDGIAKAEQALVEAEKNIKRLNNLKTSLSALDVALKVGPTDRMWQAAQQVVNDPTQESANKALDAVKSACDGIKTL